MTEVSGPCTAPLTRDPDGNAVRPPAGLAAGPGQWERDAVEPRWVELWRVGGTREGEELAFPIHGTASADGRLAIPDFMLREVVVVDTDGTWSGSWTTPGHGPGEVVTPVAAGWTASGTLVVFDIEGQKVAFLDSTGPVEADLPVDPSSVAPIVASGELPWAGVSAGGLVLLMPTPEVRTGPDGERVVERAVEAIAPGAVGARPLVAVGRVLPPATPEDARPPEPPPIAVAVAGDRIALAAGTAYEIEIREAGGRVLRLVCRDAEPLPPRDRERTQPRVARASERVDEMLAARQREDPPAVGRLVLGTRGRLWVQRERAWPMDTREYYNGVPGATYDVFDAYGMFLGTLKAPDRTRVVAVRGDTVWSFEVGELDETWVVAYRIETAMDR
jgi:hypothetical protein